ncbi:hypothetical protein ACP275_07G079900 [Erythranthe tilingii]
MQSSEENSVLTRMAEMRLVCEREIPIQQQRIDSLHTYYRNSFDSAKSDANLATPRVFLILWAEELEKLKEEYREAEEALVKARAEKTRKAAKKMAIMESISAAQARGERKENYAAIISQHSEALAVAREKCQQKIEHREQIEEAISWYNRVLGFRIECGHGVKFIFTNIDPKNPDEEYSFTIRHENEIYTLLTCDPQLNDTKELVNELNKSNGLFEFVRTMRVKFQEAASHGVSPHGPSLDQDSSMISLSAPVASVSTDHRYKSPVKEKGLKFSESNSSSRKVGRGQTILSPGSASLRRSSRLKGKS